MTDTALATKERLTALAEGAVPEAVRALWIETLPAGDGLAELFGKHDDLSLLQKARFLLDLGRHEDAREVLGEVQGTRPGLRQVRDALVSALAGPVRVGEPGSAGDEPTLASRTLAELHAEQGDTGAAIGIYRQILAGDPQDHGARQRLEELLCGKRPRRPEDALVAWLARVRRWRGELGV